MTSVSYRAFFEEITTTYRRYLFTQNFLPQTERGLREAFWRALGSEGVFYRDPLVSAIPAHDRAEPLQELTAVSARPQLHPGLLRLARPAFDVTKALYTHQVQSLERALAGRNLIVATGTGSGKTECFLLPILDDALRNPGPGVRAIVVYPLNALANDQLTRLRSLLRDLPEVTFGRYTGDTPWTRDAADPEVAEVLEPNERYSREELRTAPPQILLTNFAMLEYLLLRPQDTGLFEPQRLRYVVLDEAHSYSGAQGIDVGLLMRRLALGFPARKLQFILTSATLGEDLARIASFGQALTGAPFSVEDIIQSQRTGGFSTATQSWDLATYVAAVSTDEKLRQWAEALQDIGRLRALIAESDLPAQGAVGNSVEELLAAWMRANAQLAKLHSEFSKQPLTLREAATTLFGESSRAAERIVEWLVLLGTRAKEGPDAAPLLPARFHAFYRGLRGASVCLSPGCLGNDPSEGASGNLMLEDRVTCTRCSGAALPLSTCVHCGLPVVRLREATSGQWVPAVGTGAGKVHLLTWSTGSFEDDEDVQDESSQVQLCLRCRKWARVGNLASCCAEPVVVSLRPVAADDDGNASRCPSCGGSARPFPTVFRAFGGGEDASTAVLAEAILRSLPGDDETRPADGRRLLVFSDSRQRAAYFAPYLARTTAQSQYLLPIATSLRAAMQRSDHHRCSLDEAAREFLKIVLRQPFVVVRRTDAEEGDFVPTVRPSKGLYDSEKRGLRTEATIALLENFTAAPRMRNNLAALGVAAVEVELNDDQRERLPARLPELFERGATQGWDAVQSFLAVFVVKRALRLPEGISLRHLSQGPELATFHHSRQARHGTRQVWRWNPYRATHVERVLMGSLQAEIAAAALGANKLTDRGPVEALLDKVWDTFRDLEVLSPFDANEYQIDCERLSFFLPERWLICRRCGAISPRSVRSRCVLPGCSGDAVPVLPADLLDWFQEHHWYQRATATSPLPVEVREHTAQLTNEQGRAYQREFMAGRVNVLSSSTTFEMGVDVGRLRAVLLRNVPPTAANYIQRAGRAGRRLEGAAFAVTFARSIPHDQVHFEAPATLVHGAIPVPRINLGNARLGQRHVNSFLLGRFLRSTSVALPGELSRVSAKWFFLDPDSSGTPVAVFEGWLGQSAAGLEADLESLIKGTSLGVGDVLRASQEGLDECRAGFAARLEAYRSQEQEVLAQLNTHASGSSGLAFALTSIRRLIDQLQGESFIDTLAGSGWLPSYAFPQDVVRLVVRDAKLAGRMRLERDVEYGISEYAPGAEIIADGKLLRSGGVDLQNRELDIQHYRSCARCRQVQVALRAEDLVGICPYCSAPAVGSGARPTPFVIPRGFTTLLSEPATDVRVHRTLPPRASEIFLLGGAPNNAFVEHPTVTGIQMGHSPSGELFRANPGRKNQGFRLCRRCGRAVVRQAPHDTPWGTRCGGGPVNQVHLACRFKTDTLQLRFGGARPSPPTVDDRRFWLSWQTAFVVAAADVLDIPSRDLGATYRSQAEGSLLGELVVFDRVPGGAGYVAAVQDRLPDILETALRRTQQCLNPACDPLGSCYSCLRSYDNQFAWEYLCRQLVGEWLARVLGR